MRFARQKRDHTHIRRDLVPLDARAPALITLPIPLPSIPILGPLLSPLIVGANTQVATTSTRAPTQAPVTTAIPVQTVTPASTPAPAPTPTPTSSTSGNDNGNSGDNNRGSNGDSSGSGSSDGNTSDVGGVPNVGTRTSTLSSPQPSNASENTSSGGDGSDGGSSSDGASSSSTILGNNLNGSNQNANGVGDANPTGGSGSSGSGSGIAGNGDTASPSTAPPKGLTGSTASPDPNGATNTGKSASGDFGIPKGAIAGMVIVITLGLIAVIIVVFRGRHRRRRSERRDRWWNRAGTRLSAESDYTASTTLPDHVSFRSSFETTIDYGQTPRLITSFDTVPTLPPMAEVRGGNIIQLFNPHSNIPDSPMLIAFDTSQSPTTGSNNRTSVHSVDSSGHSSQYATAPPGSNDDLERASPVSVRPFSPSESFSFPMPPKSQSGDWSSSRPLSTATTHSSPRSPQTATPVVPALPSNPFSDPSNPFSDPVSPISPTESTTTAEIESIRRPFDATRSDELTVNIADNVKVLQLFDDGWALVRKLPPSSGDVPAKEGTNTRGVLGLIPIDCFRAAGQDLSSFFSEKRVSSTLYTNSDNVVMAI